MAITRYPLLLNLMSYSITLYCVSGPRITLQQALVKCLSYFLGILFVFSHTQIYVSDPIWVTENSRTPNYLTKNSRHVMQIQLSKKGNCKRGLLFRFLCFISKSSNIHFSLQSAILWQIACDRNLERYCNFGGCPYSCFFTMSRSSVRVLYCTDEGFDRSSIRTGSPMSYS